MDTITHGITGALVAKSFVGERESRLATLAVTLGAVFPDSDVLARLFTSDPLARLEIHRGVTHSFLALPLWALLFGGLTCLWTRPRRWLLFSCLYGAGIALHILLDLITSYGTMIWAPWSKARVAWDLTFIIDLTFTGIVLLPQLAAWVYSTPRQAARRGCAAWLLLSLGWAAGAWASAALQIPLSPGTVVAASVVVAFLLWMPSLGGRGFRWRRAVYCRVGAAALAVYLLLCGIAHRTALARVEEFAKSSGAVIERLAALPAPPSPWWWSGLVQTPEGIYRLSIHLTETDLPAYRFFASAEKNLYLQKAEALTDVQTYLWFARFPWVTYRHENGFHVVEYRDIQFFWPPGRTPPFTLRVSLDGQGRVVSSVLLEP